VRSDVDGGAWLDPANVARFARAVEAAGVHAIAFTDHPAPSGRWLANGGHETFDPFVALGFCAAATSTLRLMTRLAVLPYRNPLLTAKCMASVDVLSGGRSIFVLGAGYLRSEFRALGVDFAERNALFDEAVQVITGIFGSDDLHFAGRHFVAAGQAGRPRPVQRPHPPLWLGGNSPVVLDRVARFGQGWAPMLGGAALASAARTTAIDSLERLRQLLRELRERLERAGRSPTEIAVLAGGDAADLGAALGPAERADGLAALAAAGVTHCMVRFPHDSAERAVDLVARFAAERRQS